MALVLDVRIEDVFEERKIIYAPELTLEAPRAKLFLKNFKHDGFSAAGPAYDKNIGHELTRRCFLDIPFPFAGFRRAA